MDENRKSQLLLIAAGLIILAVLSAFRVIDSSRANSLQAVPVSVSLTEYTESNDSGDKVNINTADVALLMTLEEIGETRAKAIIAYREKNGRFRSADELALVDGIGEKTVELNRSRITV